MKFVISKALRFDISLARKLVYTAPLSSRERGFICIF